LLVVSVDGLDHRYLSDRDKLGLKIPNMRRLLSRGRWAGGGVIGVVPTVTFPSHTTLVTGVTPDHHGIINNNDPATGERYWYASRIRVPVLWDAARKAGLKTGAIEWPVTVGAAIDFNFPEHFKRRLGGGMDMAAHEAVSTPGFLEKVAARYPSFPREWVDDRVRTQAVLYLLKHEKVDLILVHLVDHDSEAHEHGPFTRRAIAALEFADECIGEMLAAMPKDMAFALVSDHGFELRNRVVNPAKYAPAAALEVRPFWVAARSAAAADSLRGKDGIGREIPAAEIAQRAPSMAGMILFESAPHVAFGEKEGSGAHGEHGFWPLRANFRSVYLLSGPGFKRGDIGEIEMTSIAARLAAVLGLKFP
jgi:predicted AlkP superfamily pyrophosphatase or phosphodiesterase